MNCLYCSGVRPESKIETSSNKPQAKFLLEVWHIFALIAVVNLVFFVIASQVSWESAKHQSSLILLYFPIFLCRLIHKGEPNKNDNSNKIANISIISSFIYPLFFHTIFMSQIVYGNMDVSSDPGGFGQAVFVFGCLSAGLIVTHSYLMISIGLLINKFSIIYLILAVVIILLNASVIGILFI